MVESLQRSAGNAAVNRLMVADSGATADPASGEPLPPKLRAAGERRLGEDLAEVRLHTDATAAAFAQSLGAEAVTLGRDIFMGPRAGDIGSSDGRRTLMHELTHTVQSAGQDAIPVRGVSSPSGAAETEAIEMAEGGLAGASRPVTQVAAAGMAHRKVVDEEEEPKAGPMPDLLNPAPLTEKEQEEGGAPIPPKAGELGENEAIAWEIRVLAPLRRAVAAASEQEWETAVERMGDPGSALWDYEQAYAKKDPALTAELRGIRGWLALAISQMRLRYSGKQFTDDHITAVLSEAVEDLEKVSTRLR